MQNCSRLLLALLLGIFASCQDAPAPLVFKGNVSGANSVEAFKNTVYPIVKANCSSCHTSTVSPFFAQSDVALAHDTMVNSFKVNLDDPAASRIHLRMKIDLHSCWGNCESNATEMLVAIKEWAELTKTSRKLTGIKTEVVGINTSIQQYPVLGETTVFEAESGFISGRILDMASQSASGLKAVTTQKVATHPKGESTRFGEMSSQCNVTDANSYKVYNKVARHPNPNGYQPYYITLRYHPIKPSLREDYLTLLKAKGSLNPTELAPFLWRGRVYGGEIFHLLRSS